MALPLLGLAFAAAERLKDRERTLRSLSGLFLRMGAASRRRRETLPAMLGRLCEECAVSGFLPDVLALFRENGDLAAAWRAAAEKPALARVLRPEEREELRAFSAAFGEASASDFCASCAAAAAAFSDLAADANAQRIRQTRLWLGLGAFGALLTVIVLV